jgi:hypothetical protein
MGERDVDTLHNYYAEYETQERGREYFSIGCDTVQPLPVSRLDLNRLKKLMDAALAEAGAVSATAGGELPTLDWAKASRHPVPNDGNGNQPADRTA